jgi:hypothetical protein
MLPAIDDHPELGPPVADVVVANRPMADELQHLIEGVADHRRADMPHMHRLGDVRRRVVEHERPRLRDRRHAEPIDVGRRRLQLIGDERILQSQVDKTRPRDLRRLAKVGDVQPLDERRRHLARRLAEPLPQRHRAVRLIVAKLRILARQHHRRELSNALIAAGQLRQCRRDSSPKFSQNIHATHF